MDDVLAETSNRSVHDIPGVGEFRAKKGTAVDELAGAAHYWHRQAERAERAGLRRFRDGFLSGLTFTLTVGMVALAIMHVWP